jgi:hypothetical protein
VALKHFVKVDDLLSLAFTELANLLFDVLLICCFEVLIVDRAESEKDRVTRIDHAFEAVYELIPFEAEAKAVGSSVKLGARFRECVVARFSALLGEELLGPSPKKQFDLFQPVVYSPYFENSPIENLSGDPAILYAALMVEPLRCVFSIKLKALPGSPKRDAIAEERNSNSAERNPVASFHPLILATRGDGKGAPTRQNARNENQLLDEAL